MQKRNLNKIINVQSSMAKCLTCLITGLKSTVNGMTCGFLCDRVNRAWRGIDSTHRFRTLSAHVLAPIFARGISWPLISAPRVEWVKFPQEIMNTMPTNGPVGDRLPRFRKATNRAPTEQQSPLIDSALIIELCKVTGGANQSISINHPVLVRAVCHTKPLWNAVAWGEFREQCCKHSNKMRLLKKQLNKK